jgi:uncharacterized repeat protein (TIGR03803 family)
MKLNFTKQKGRIVFFTFLLGVFITSQIQAKVVLLGTAQSGGANGKGAIFEYDPANHSYAARFSFDGTATGANPIGGLVAYKDKFYGTTSAGGTYGKGTIFEYDPVKASVRTLFSFNGGGNGLGGDLDGATPSGVLLAYNDSLYGMTKYGGVNNNGVIFVINPSTGVYKKLFNFNDEVSGKYPCGGLTLFNNRLYGVTSDGGVKTGGTFFYWDLSLHSFVKKDDYDIAYHIGVNPFGSFMVNGNYMYITASKGGKNNKGVIYRYKDDEYDMLYEFAGTDGEAPEATLVLSNNMIYGTTTKGGTNGTGTLFQFDLAHSPTITKLYDFEATVSTPRAALTPYNGYLYGSTSGGNGTIFEYNPTTKKMNYLNLSTTNGTIPYYSALLIYNVRYKLAFDVSDGTNPLTGVTVKLTANNRILPYSSSVYTIDTISGSYDYEISKPGYVTQKGTIVVNDANNTQQITLTAAPEPFIAVNKGLSILEGASASVLQNVLAAFDMQQDVSALTYSISLAPAHGRLEKTTAAGTSLTTFTQTDINNGIIQYVNDGLTGTSDAFSFTVDDGAGNHSVSTTFTISVTAVNDAPSFTKGSDVTVKQDCGDQNITGWATAISKGGTDESAQTLKFRVSNDNPALFYIQPLISTTSGTLTFRPNAGVYGVATVSVRLGDNGGTANGGADSSAVQTFIITVTQPPFMTVSSQPISIAAKSGTASVTLTSNVDWSVSSDKDWLTISPSSGKDNGTLTITAQDNPTVSSRSANVYISGTNVNTITISVTQAAGDPTLSLSPGTLNMTAASGAGSFNVITNTSWSVSCPESWIQLQPVFGSGNSTIYLTANANASISERTAVVTVTAGGLSQTVTVVQAGAEPQLSIVVNSISLAAGEGSSSSFDISSNTDWTISSSQSWLTANKTSGTGNAALTVTATANTTTAVRQAVITISGAGKVIQLSVTQAFSGAILSVSTNSLSLSGDGGTASFSIVSNASWTITASESWLTFSKTSDTGNGTITVTAAANPSASQRTASIVVTGAGITQQIALSQPAATTTLDVSATTLNVSATSGSTASFSITSTISWTVSSAESWLTTSKTSGSGNASVIVTASVNTTASPRDAVVTISGSGITRTVTVTQAAGATGIQTLTEENVRIYPNPADDEITVEIKQCFPSDIISVYTVDGIWLMSQKVKTKISRLNLSKLKAGIYLLKINNSVIRFVKK